MEKSISVLKIFYVLNHVLNHFINSESCDVMMTQQKVEYTFFNTPFEK